jgi:hypothetical protein
LSVFPPLGFAQFERFAPFEFERFERFAPFEFERFERVAARSVRAVRVSNQVKPV